LSAKSSSFSSGFYLFFGAMIVFGVMNLFLALTACSIQGSFSVSDRDKNQALVIDGNALPTKQKELNGGNNGELSLSGETVHVNTKIHNNIRRNGVAREGIFLTRDDSRSLQQDTCTMKLAELGDCLTTTYGCDSDCVMGATQLFMDGHNFTCVSFKSDYCPTVAACGCRTCYEEITDYYTCSSSDCDFQCNSPEPSNGGTSVGVIVGAIGGTVIVIGLIIMGAVYYFYKAKSQRNSKTSSENENGMEYIPSQGSPVASMSNSYNSEPGIPPKALQMHPGAYVGGCPAQSKRNHQAHDGTSYSKKSNFHTQTSNNHCPEEQYYIRPPPYSLTAKDQCLTVLTPNNGGAQIVEAMPVMDDASSASNFIESSNAAISRSCRPRLDP
jgi:hypothetical protein